MHFDCPFDVVEKDESVDTPVIELTPEQELAREQAMINEYNEYEADAFATYYTDF